MRVVDTVDNSLPQTPSTEEHCVGLGAGKTEETSQRLDDRGRSELEVSRIHSKSHLGIQLKKPEEFRTSGSETIRNIVAEKPRNQARRCNIVAAELANQLIAARNDGGKVLQCVRKDIHWDLDQKE